MKTRGVCLSVKKHGIEAVEGRVWVSAVSSSTDTGRRNWVPLR